MAPGALRCTGAGESGTINVPNQVNTDILNMALQPFHLAFPVDDLAKARAFYGDLMGCPEGRSSPEWVDFDFYGHQIVAHLLRR